MYSFLCFLLKNVWNKIQASFLLERVRVVSTQIGPIRKCCHIQTRAHGYTFKIAINLGRTYDQTNIICSLKIQNRPLSIAVWLLHRLKGMSTFLKSSALVKERQKGVNKASLMLMWRFPGRNPRQVPRIYWIIC